MNASSIWQMLKQTFAEWNEDKAARLAAALAFYTALSLAPLLTLTIVIVSIFYDQQTAQTTLVEQVLNVTGSETIAEAIGDIIANANTGSGGIWATIISIATLLFGASGVFLQLEDALNTVWDVQERPGQSLLDTIKQRLLSFAMVLSIGFLLLVSLVITAVITTIGTYFENIVPGWPWVWQIINFAISYGVTLLLFAAIYKVVPAVKIGWGDVWMGAAVTALLFSVGRQLLALYLGSSAPGSAYGAAGSLMALLLWVYYSAQILFFGAEFTQVYTRRHGTQVVPTEHAIPLTPEARAAQGMPKQAHVQQAMQLSNGTAVDSQRPPVPLSTPFSAVVGFMAGFLLGRRQRQQ